MSISDNNTANEWKPWSPDNLLADNSSSIMTTFPITDDNSDDAAKEAALQAERARARQQAEKTGFEQGHNEGYEAGKKAGFDAGREEGLLAGREEGRKEMAVKQEEMSLQLNSLLQSMQGSLDSLDYIIPSRLMQLALSAARSLLATDTIGEISTALVQERIQKLLRDEPLFKSDACLWVSEQDKPLIEAKFANTLAERGWSLNVDKNMHQGGCRITSDDMELDESLEMRWKMLCSLASEEH